MLGVKPRIIGAPGLATQAVVTALSTVAQKLRAMAYAYCDGCDTLAQAITYRNQFSARELMLLWPNYIRFDTATAANVEAYSEAYALGLRAAIDRDTGWHKTLSNVAVNGVVGITKPVFWDLQQSEPTPTCSTPPASPPWSTTTATASGAAAPATTKACSSSRATPAPPRSWPTPWPRPMCGPTTSPCTPAWPRTSSSPSTPSCAASRPRATSWTARPGWTNRSTPATRSRAASCIDYDYTPLPPLEDLTFRQRITDTYWADFAGRVAA
jgi:hypothetical protein